MQQKKSFVFIAITPIKANFVSALFYCLGKICQVGKINQKMGRLPLMGGTSR
jgi:hypothetical protein